MRHFWPLLALVGAGLLVFASSVRSAPDEGREMLLRTRAPSIVEVKAVYRLTATAEGETETVEESHAGLGVVVDPSGLVMVSRNILDPTYYEDPLALEGIETKVEIVSARLVLPGTTEEHDVVLVARDTQLGLGFLALPKAGTRRFPAVDLGNARRPTLDGNLYVVSRLPEAFDDAPYCVALQPAGRVEKPRAMWFLRGDGTQDVGGFDPVYWADGALAGFCVHHRIAPESEVPDAFLVEVARVRPLIAKALQKARELQAR